MRFVFLAVLFLVSGPCFSLTNSERETLTKLLTTYEIETANLKTTRDELSLQISNLKKILSEKDQILSEIDSELTQREKDLSEKEQRLKDLEPLIQDLKDQLKDSQAEINNLENSLTWTPIEYGSVGLALGLGLGWLLFHR